MTDETKYEKIRVLIRDKAGKLRKLDCDGFVMVIYNEQGDRIKVESGTYGHPHMIASAVRGAIDSGNEAGHFISVGVMQSTSFKGGISDDFREN